MPNRAVAFALVTGLAALASAACPEPPFTGPSPVSGMAISSLVPSSGTTVRTTAVTIVGRGFRPGATVTFGGVEAVVTGVTETTITAIAPIDSQPATVDVVVSHPDRKLTSNAKPFEYIFVPPPSIVSVSPSEGSTGGGTRLTVTGAAFQLGAAVTVDGIPAAGVFRAQAGNLLVFDTAAHGAGTVDIAVLNPDGQSTGAPGRFTYLSPDAFNFNGNWSAFLGNGDDFPFDFTIQNNALVSVTCAEVAPVAISPPALVSHGEVSATGPGGVTFSARIVSADTAVGAINFSSRCSSLHWTGFRVGSAVARSGMSILGVRRIK